MQNCKPGWPVIHKELRHPLATLYELWCEHGEQMGFGNSFADFHRCYWQWHDSLSLSMRQEGKAGGLMYIFYGKVPNSYLLVDTTTGEVLPACLFVAVLGASGYVYAEASLSSSVENLIDCQFRAFHFFGGATRYVLPYLVKDETDFQLDRYEHLIGTFNSKVLLLSEAFMKRQVELQIILRWLRAQLRTRLFESLPELNACILYLAQEANTRPFTKLAGSRKDWFESFEKAALTDLPPLSTTKTIWLRKLVPDDLHINVGGHYYSVPVKLDWVDVRVTGKRVTLLSQGKRIISHRRSDAVGLSTSKKSHAYKSGNNSRSGWSTDRLLRWASQIGPATRHLIATILSHAQYSQAGVRACLGILSLEREYGRERLESVCRRAAGCSNWSVQDIRRTLESGLDQTSVQLMIPMLHVPPPKDSKKGRP